MFRSLVGRALFPVGVAVTGFVIVCCLMLYSAIRSGVNRDAVLNATNMADTILKSTRYAMLKSDRETLATVIHNIGEQKGVEHVRIFNKKGVVNFSAKVEELNHQVDKSSEGCNICHSGAVPLTSVGSMKQARTFTNSNGKSVMAITTPIYNEPDCFNAACHVHQPGQKILGTLDVGLSQEALNSSLALIRTQMIIFTLMTLVLTLGGVTALLRRSVFLPIQQLLTFVDVSVAAKKNVPLPSHLPDDLNRIAIGCQSLVHKLHQAEQEKETLAQKTADKE